MSLVKPNRGTLQSFDFRKHCPVCKAGYIKRGGTYILKHDPGCPNRNREQGASR